ncbi:Nitrate reductase NapE component OS=Streptomyces albaduncus OX=68172 GN=FHS32_001310 PE=4 SV=1 [Streptomyces griseoloalbus]
MLDFFLWIMGIAEDDVFVTTQRLHLSFDLTAWGWTHLVLGAIAVLVDLGLRDDALWARSSGGKTGGLVVITNVLSLPY